MIDETIDRGPRVKALRTLSGAGSSLRHGGRDRRHQPVRKRPQAGGPGRADPTVQGSDLKVRHGQISKQGPAWLGLAMNQAAQAGIPPLMAANCGNFWRPTVKLQWRFVSRWQNCGL